MPGLSDNAQAVLSTVSAGCIAAASYIGIQPSIPDNIKGPVIALGFVLGVLGFGIKEALGSQPSATPATTPSK